MSPDDRRPIDAQHAQATADQAGLTGAPTLLGAGWDAAVWQVGDAALRLPRTPAADASLAVEARWLPALAPSLPLALPTPRSLLPQTAARPYPAAVVDLVPGRDLLQALSDLAPGDRPAAGARWGATLGCFLRALHSRAAPAEAPANPFRGVPLSERDPAVRARIGELGATDLPSAAHAAWDAAVQLPPFAGVARWCHGDLHPLNLIARDGALVGVIDWADLHAGDPAPDLAVAWLLPNAAEALFAAYGLADPQLVARARGWALFFAITFLAHGIRMVEPAYATIARTALCALDLSTPVA